MAREQRASQTTRLRNYILNSPAWDEFEDYVAEDLVREGNTLYIAVGDNSGVRPSMDDGTNWTQITADEAALRDEIQEWNNVRAEVLRPGFDTVPVTGITWLVANVTGQTVRFTFTTTSATAFAALDTDPTYRVRFTADLGDGDTEYTMLIELGDLEVEGTDVPGVILRRTINFDNAPNSSVSPAFPTGDLDAFTATATSIEALLAADVPEILFGDQGADFVLRPGNNIEFQQIEETGEDDRLVIHAVPAISEGDLVAFSDADGFEHIKVVRSPVSDVQVVTFDHLDTNSDGVDDTDVVVLTLDVGDAESLIRMTDDSNSPQPFVKITTGFDGRIIGRYMSAEDETTNTFGRPIRRLTYRVIDYHAPDAREVSEVRGQSFDFGHIAVLEEIEGVNNYQLIEGTTISYTVLGEDDTARSVKIAPVRDDGYTAVIHPDRLTLTAPAGTLGDADAWGSFEDIGNQAPFGFVTTILPGDILAVSSDGFRAVVRYSITGSFTTPAATIGDVPTTTVSFDLLTFQSDRFELPTAGNTLTTSDIVHLAYTSSLPSININSSTNELVYVFEDIGTDGIHRTSTGTAIVPRYYPPGDANTPNEIPDGTNDEGAFIFGNPVDSEGDYIFPSLPTADPLDTARLVRFQYRAQDSTIGVNNPPNDFFTNIVDASNIRLFYASLNPIVSGIESVDADGNITDVGVAATSFLTEGVIRGIQRDTATAVANRNLIMPHVSWYIDRTDLLAASEYPHQARATYDATTDVDEIALIDTRRNILQPSALEQQQFIPRVATTATGSFSVTPGGDITIGVDDVTGDVTINASSPDLGAVVRLTPFSTDDVAIPGAAQQVPILRRAADSTTVQDNRSVLDIVGTESGELISWVQNNVRNYGTLDNGIPVTNLMVSSYAVGGTLTGNMDSRSSQTIIQDALYSVNFHGVRLMLTAGSRVEGNTGLTPSFTMTIIAVEGAPDVISRLDTDETDVFEGFIQSVTRADHVNVENVSDNLFDFIPVDTANIESNGVWQVVFPASRTTVLPDGRYILVSDQVTVRFNDFNTATRGSIHSISATDAGVTILEGTKPANQTDLTNLAFLTEAEYNEIFSNAAIINNGGTPALASGITSGEVRGLLQISDDATPKWDDSVTYGIGDIVITLGTWNSVNGRFDIATGDNLRYWRATGENTNSPPPINAGVWNEVTPTDATKADTDLQNIDDDLTPVEQHIVRDRIGATQGGTSATSLPQLLDVSIVGEPEETPSPIDARLLSMFTNAANFDRVYVNTDENPAFMSIELQSLSQTRREAVDQLVGRRFLTLTFGSGDAGEEVALHVRDVETPDANSRIIETTVLRGLNVLQANSTQTVRDGITYNFYEFSQTQFARISAVVTSTNNSAVENGDFLGWDAEESVWTNKPAVLFGTDGWRNLVVGDGLSGSLDAPNAQATNILTLGLDSSRVINYWPSSFTTGLALVLNNGDIWHSTSISNGAGDWLWNGADNTVVNGEAAWLEFFPGRSTMSARDWLANDVIHRDERPVLVDGDGNDTNLGAQFQTGAVLVIGAGRQRGTYSRVGDEWIVNDGDHFTPYLHQGKRMQFDDLGIEYTSGMFAPSVLPSVVWDATNQVYTFEDDSLYPQQVGLAVGDYIAMNFLGGVGILRVTAVSTDTYTVRQIQFHVYESGVNAGFPGGTTTNVSYAKLANVTLLSQAFKISLFLGTYNRNNDATVDLGTLTGITRQTFTTNGEPWYYFTNVRIASYTATGTPMLSMTATGDDQLGMWSNRTDPTESGATTFNLIG